MPSVTAGALFSYDMARSAQRWTEQKTSSACLYFDGVRHGVSDYVGYDYCEEHCSLFSFDQPLAGSLVQSMTTSSRDKLWRAMLSCSSVGQPLAGFSGEADAFDSHEHGWSDLRKSLIAAAPT